MEAEPLMNGRPEHRIPRSAHRRWRRRVLAVVAAGAILAAGIVAAWPRGVRVQLWNCTSGPLDDVVVGLQGRCTKIGSIRGGGVGSVRIRPMGEAHAVNVAFTPAGGRRHEHAVEVYLESNYYGRVLVFVQGYDFQVTAAARIRLAVPIGPSDCLTTPVSPVPANP